MLSKGDELLDGLSELLVELEVADEEALELLEAELLAGLDELGAEDEAGELEVQPVNEAQASIAANTTAAIFFRMKNYLPCVAGVMNESLPIGCESKRLGQLCH